MKTKEQHVLSANAGIHEKGTFTVQDAINNIKKNANYHKAGAIALFIGVVRGETLEGEKVKSSNWKHTKKKPTKSSAKYAMTYPKNLE